MRAAWYERTGSAREVLTVGQMADPKPGPGEVLVRVHVSGVNPSDVKSRAGQRGGLAFPRIVPHSDGAGVVAAVGPGIDPGRVGERVWLWNGQWRRAHGTAAELIALPAAQAVALPQGIAFAAGACLGIPALTAHRCVFADGPVAGQSVLVTGGAGAVGHYAIELAKWGGAAVIATCSGPEKAQAARAAGADHVLDYRREDVAARVLEITGGSGVDRIVEVEFGGNLAAGLAVLKENGVIAAYASTARPTPELPFYPLMFKAATLRLVLVYLLPEAARRQGIADLTRALVDGALTHPVTLQVPIAEIAAAHEAVEAGGKIGAVLVTID